jgi:hypothetical protein
METVQPISSGETLGRAQRMTGLRERSLCPCGDESLDTARGMHVVGAKCREQVARHVRRRFGPHRFGGRYAADVEDLIQDCYRNLLAPSGLDKFQPAVGRERSDAFRAWLWRVVHNHCNNKEDYFRAHPEVGGDTLDRLHESRHAITPEQAFARTRILEIIAAAAAVVEPAWRAKGPKGSQRFDVIVALVCEEIDVSGARERLDITSLHVRQLKWQLADELRPEVRKQIRDDLLLPPGSDPEAIEREIDQEIEALFQAAYPGSSVSALFSSEPEPDAESNGEQLESRR